jgi:hypothetical protein
MTARVNVRARPRAEVRTEATGAATGAVPHVAEELDNTSRQTRKARYRSLFALLVLTVVAVGAVAAGIFAKNAAFWAGASIVFYMALAAVITYAANELGIVSKTAELLRAALKTAGSTPELAKPAEPSEAAPDVGRAALVLAERFANAGQLAEAEQACLMAVQENGAKDALYFLAGQCFDRGDYKESELWLLKAVGRGHLGASYRLGCLHRIHGQSINDETYKRMFAQGISIAAYIIGRGGIVEDDSYPDDYEFPTESRFSRDDLAKYTVDPAADYVRPDLKITGEITAIHRPRKSEILKDLADALPGYVEFWHAYFVSLLDDGNSKYDVDGAIGKVMESLPDSYGLQLLRVRFHYWFIDQIDISGAPASMRAELNLHKAICFVNGFNYEDFYFSDEHQPDDRDPDEELRLIISEARHYQDEPPWRSQLLGIEAAHEYVLKHYQKAGQLLRDVLNLKPVLVEPFSLDDISSLALVFEFWGDKAAAPLVSDLARVRPMLQGVLHEDNENRKQVFRKLISSIAPGVDMRVPIPGSPQFSGADMVKLIDSAGVSRD